MEVRDGALWEGQQKLSQVPSDAKRRKKAEEVVAAHFQKELEKAGLKQINVPFHPSRFSLAIRDQEDCTDRYWLWQRPQTENYQAGEHLAARSLTRHLILLTASEYSSPGLWNLRGALINSTRENCSIFGYFNTATKDPYLDYQSICLLCPKQSDDPQRLIRAQYQVETSIRHMLTKSMAHGLIDVITDDVGGICMYNFLRRNPRFSSRRIGHVIMLNSGADIRRDLLRTKTDPEFPCDTARDCDDFSVPEVNQFVRTRCLNVTESASSPCGCPSIRLHPEEGLSFSTSAREVVFYYLHNRLLDHKLYRLRTILFTILFVLFALIVYAVKDLK